MNLQISFTSLEMRYHPEHTEDNWHIHPHPAGTTRWMNRMHQLLTGQLHIHPEEEMSRDRFQLQKFPTWSQNLKQILPPQFSSSLPRYYIVPCQWAVQWLGIECSLSLFVWVDALNKSHSEDNNLLQTSFILKSSKKSSILPLFWKKKRWISW